MRSPVQSWVSLLSKNTEDEALAVKMQVLFVYMGLRLIQLIREAAANIPDKSLIVTPRIDQSEQTSLIYPSDPTMTRESTGSSPTITGISNTHRR